MPATFAGYDLLMPVAKGGMAAVWTARARGAFGFQRTVAIKVLRADLADSPDFRTMFLDEARVSAMVRHPNVADVLDFGEDGNILYIVMEWVDGESIARLRKAAKALGGIPLRISLRIAEEAAAGLHAAHELSDGRGNPIELVHRDVSPSNILVSTHGFVKLIDFGVAKSNARAYQTSGGPALKGKASYLSPEQVNGEPLDRRSDIFSFGTMLYSLTTGRHPFRADTLLKTAENVAAAAPVKPREIAPTMPPALENIILKALAADPAKRFSSSLELQVALRKVLSAMGNPTNADVADFVDKALGPHLARRAAKLSATIAAFDEADAIRRGPQTSAPDEPSLDLNEELVWADEEENTPPAAELPPLGAASAPPVAATAPVDENTEARALRNAETMPAMAARPTAPIAAAEEPAPWDDFDEAQESLFTRPRRRRAALMLFAAALLAGGVAAYVVGPSSDPERPQAPFSTAAAQPQHTAVEVAPPPLPPPPPSLPSEPAREPERIEPPAAAMPAEPQPAPVERPARRATPSKGFVPPPSAPPRPPAPRSQPARSSKFNPKEI
jgi:serine/threonine protein kinase